MSIPGFESVFTSVGNLRNEIEGKLTGKADKYEITSLDSKIRRLEHTIGNLSSQFSELCSRIQTLEEDKLKESQNG